jgi:ABC-type Zn uptake system ZnuABC Zn-binding protein ZnuA
MRRLSLLVVALALVTAGCGGGNESAASEEATTAETTTTAEDAMTAETTTGETSTGTTDLSGALGDEDCLALVSVGASIAQAFAGAGGTTDEDRANLEELANKVPDEIKADVQTLAQAFATYSEKLKDIGIEPGSTPTAGQLQQLQAAIASLDQQKLTAASNRIEAWAKANCQG